MKNKSFLLVIVVLLCSIIDYSTQTDCDVYIKSIPTIIDSSSTTNSSSSSSSSNVCGDSWENACGSLAQGFQVCSNLGSNINYQLMNGIYKLEDGDVSMDYGTMNVTFSGQLNVVFNLGSLTRPFFVTNNTTKISIVKINYIKFTNATMGVISNLQSKTEFYIQSCTFLNCNYATSNGVSLVLFDSTTPVMFIQNTVFINNSIQSNNKNFGDISLIDSTSAYVLLTNCSFSNNNGFNTLISGVGGEIMFNITDFSDNIVSGNGLLQLINQTETVQTIENVHFINNGLTTGIREGGSLVSTSNAFVSIKSCEFTNNGLTLIRYMLDKGQGSPEIFNNITNCQFQNNSGSIQIIQSNTTFYVTNNQFTSNQGPIFNVSGTTLNLVNGVFNENSGTLFSLYQSNVSIQGISLSNNKDFQLVSCNSSTISLDNIDNSKQTTDNSNLINCNQCNLTSINSDNYQCNSDESKSKKNTLTRGQIIAIALSSFFFAVIISLGILYIVKRNKSKGDGIQKPLLS
ncbi:hypothetical protein DLAC_08960 [Tieghemostelium lacteum]|uniref:Right handed beta helix domain-containing protein n=1 Tax=Tieghemostelium lacteum TaxID=361077 RepID=A0A151Z8S5_TIELA|nr:hypothetical protein DLAC_08960 [Tieghemostelium lacteum]|eukprot:KYQ90346.1 hypothetical protein DLAC_08960 [Tieghemostelium lacteum]